MEDIKFDTDFFDDVDPEVLVGFITDQFKNIAIKQPYSADKAERQIKTLKRLSDLVIKIKETQLILYKQKDKECNP